LGSSGGQLFGIEAPASVEFTGWRKYFNSYTPQGRRNVSVFLIQRRSKQEKVTSGPTV
uniref:Uncharacterized protein n=1 Tax=Neogobius melanostomus TaxID=47308 RepID=A0A8C6TKH9_9GOBI